MLLSSCSKASSTRRSCMWFESLWGREWRLRNSASPSEKGKADCWRKTLLHAQDPELENVTRFLPQGCSGTHAHLALQVGRSYSSLRPTCDRTSEILHPTRAPQCSLQHCLLCWETIQVEPTRVQLCFTCITEYNTLKSKLLGFALETGCCYIAQDGFWSHNFSAVS